MESNEIRKRFLKFFEERGHSVIPSASLVPENDPSVLFTTAGMQPLVPYLLGQPHPKGKRLVNVQKCVRTGDIDDIGDNRHLTFFQMLGNWSLGDYFKKDAISWSYELLTSKEEGFGLDPHRLYVTVFEGDENAPMDAESIDIWKSLGVPESRIYTLGIDDNWWSPGENGPCGPDTEMFYDLTDSGLGELSKEAFLDAVKREDVVEIWNDVFMEYEKKDGKVVGKLPVQNVDTGAGLERLSAVLQGKKTAYDTDLFQPIISEIHRNTTSEDERGIRIVADHLRAAVFMVADGVIPSNTERGYVLRKLIRRASYYYHSLSNKTQTLEKLVSIVIHTYKNSYSELELNSVNIHEIIKIEELNFISTIESGKKQFEKIVNSIKDTTKIINGHDAFILFSTHGFPIELTVELAKENNFNVDLDGFHNELVQHKELSRTASAGMFKGGLANHSEKTIRLHTAHHLLLAALQEVLGKDVKQRGSNITEERLRIDFSFERKLTSEEILQVESIVNKRISEGLNVIRKEMPLVEAETIGAEMEFGAKYPDIVSVYFIEGSDGKVVSKEFCGGPHVSNTSELGTFKIQKEESVSAGVRRIKATLS